MSSNIKQLFVPEVYLGPNCNNRCSFCSLNKEDFPRKSAEDVRKELKIIKKFADDVKFTGGEVTIRPNIMQIISYAKSLGFKNICIESNGRKFSDKEYARKMIKSGANIFSVFIYGHKPKLHEKLTGVKGSFGETVSGIKNLVRYAGNVLNVEVIVAITKLNYKYLSEIAKFSWKLGVGHVTLSFATACGSLLINKEAIPTISDVITYITDVLNTFSDRNMGISYIPPCFLEGHEKYINFIKIPSKMVIKNPNFTMIIESELKKNMLKGSTCKKCRFDDICYGLWKEYANLYGLNELKPVLGRKVKTLEQFEKEFC